MEANTNMSADTASPETEVTTTETTTAAPAPAEGAQEESLNTFQKFLKGLFSGEKEDTSAGTGTDTGEDGKDQPKTYSEADVQGAVESARKEWEASQAERERLNALSPEDRAAEENKTAAQEATELKAELLRRDLKDAALADLEKEGFPISLADLLNYTDETSMKDGLEKIKEAFKGSLTTAVNERLRGKTPAGLGGAARSENAMQDQIAKNIRGGF